MKWIIIDCNEMEEDVEINSIKELREWATDMLEGYFEARSDYGNPVRWLMPYVAEEKLVTLIKNYNYEVREEE